MGRLKTVCGCPVTKQSGTEGTVQGPRNSGATAQLLRMLRGTWNQDCLLEAHGRSQEPGTPMGFPGGVKVGLTRSQLWSWRSAKKDRAFARQTFSKQEHHRCFYPNLMHKTSADSYTVSVILKRISILL